MIVATAAVVVVGILVDVEELANFEAELVVVVIVVVVVVVMVVVVVAMTPINMYTF